MAEALVIIFTVVVLGLVVWVLDFKKDTGVDAPGSVTNVNVEKSDD